MNDYKAQQAARAAAAAALQAANPHLLASVKGGALQAAGKNARIELARAFPGVTFSVRTRRFSGGDAMDVSWTDGPTSSQVDGIIGRYAAGSFSGMDDSYSYSRDAWTEAFGDAKYVHARREHSDAAVASCARLACRRFGIDASRHPAEGLVAAFRQGALRSIRPDNGPFDLGDLIYQELARRTYSINRTPAARPMAEDGAVTQQGVSA